MGYLQRIIQWIKNITTLITECILFIIAVNIMDYFVSNSVYHNSNTRQKNDLHFHHVILAMYQKGVYYSGIKNINGLPKAMKDISSKHNKFKVALKHFLHTHWFYSLDEFFNKR